MRTLDERLHAAAAPTRGAFAWVVEDPTTGESSTHNANTAFPGASTMKIAILVRLLEMADAGAIRLADRLCLRAWHQVGGAGILQYLAPGTTLTVADVATLMTVLSDNTATNMALDLTGCAAPTNVVGDGISAIRRYYGKPEMPLPDDRPFSAIVSAAGLASIYRRALNGTVLSPESRAVFWQALERQQDRGSTPRYFDDTVRIAHKTGAIDGVRHDAGVFWVPDTDAPRRDFDPMAMRGAGHAQGRPIIFVALSRDLADRRWSVENEGEAAIGRLARTAFDWFAATRARA